MFYNRRRPRFFFFPLLALVFLLVLGGVVMLLWNAILPGLFHVRNIAYWEALGLLVLCRILFGNFRHGGPPSRHKGPGWREKWMNMTPEERDRFRQEWKNKCRKPGEQQDSA